MPSTALLVGAQGKSADVEARLTLSSVRLRGRLQDRRRLANFVAWALPRAAGVKSLAARYTASHQETELQARARRPGPATLTPAWPAPARGLEETRAHSLRQCVPKIFKELYRQCACWRDERRPGLAQAGQGRAGSRR